MKTLIQSLSDGSDSITGRKSPTLAEFRRMVFDATEEVASKETQFDTWAITSKVRNENPGIEIPHNLVKPLVAEYVSRYCPAFVKTDIESVDGKSVRVWVKKPD